MLGDTYRGAFATYHGQPARILRTSRHSLGLFHIRVMSGPERGLRWVSVTSDRDFRPTQVPYSAAVRP